MMSACVLAFFDRDREKMKKVINRGAKAYEKQIKFLRVWACVTLSHARVRWRHSLFVAFATRAQLRRVQAYWGPVSHTIVSLDQVRDNPDYSRVLELLVCTPSIFVQLVIEIHWSWEETFSRFAQKAVIYIFLLRILHMNYLCLTYLGRETIWIIKVEIDMEASRLFDLKKGDVSFISDKYSCLEWGTKINIVLVCKIDLKSGMYLPSLRQRAREGKGGDDCSHTVCVHLKHSFRQFNRIISVRHFIWKGACCIDHMTSQRLTHCS